MANKTYYDLVQEVKDQENILALIQDLGVEVQKKGVTYKACCPFHNEKTPSFSISEPKQMFNCFGCGEKGDVLEFVQKYKGMMFHESLMFLAKRLNIETTQYLGKPKTPADEKAQKLKQSIYISNKAATEHFQKGLGQEHKEYLYKRGFTDKTIELFQIGYSNQNDNLTQALSQHDKAVLLETGLVRQNEKGTYHDFFYDSRLMFPICNRAGQVVSFGARTLAKDVQPKYLNTSGTKVYDKSKTLYGLHLAIKHILRERFCIVVEGYTDVIGLNQNGHPNVVGKCGTAFTEEHAKIILKYTDKALFIPDGDILAIDELEAELSEAKEAKEAKKKVELLKKVAAAKKKFQTFVKEVNVCLDNGLRVEMVVLENGKDPADVGAEIGQYINQKVDAIIYLAKQIYKEARTIQEKNDAQKQIGTLIAKANESARIMYIEEIAKEHDIRINHLKKIVKDNTPVLESDKEEKRVLENLYRIKVRDTFFQLYTDVDTELNTASEYYEKRKRSELESEIGKYQVSMIPRFDGVVVEPDHTNFKYVVNENHTSFRTGGKPVQYKKINWYNPLPIKKKEYNLKNNKNIQNLMYFHEHIFGAEYLELGLDWATVLYRYPRRKLPALCLVSRRRKTGKSTFIDLYSMFYGSNAAKSSIYRLQQNFNALLMGKLLVGIEETRDERGQVEEKLKDFITGRDLIVEGKGRDAVQVKNYSKFLFASNHPENFLKITDNEDRFMVFEVPSIDPAKYDNKLMLKMREELPYWRYFLENREIKNKDMSRLWFDPSTYQTDALKKVQRHSQSPTIAAMQELIKEVFLNGMPKDRSSGFPLTTLKMSSKNLAEYMNKYLDKRGKYTPRGMSSILAQNNIMTSNHATRFLFPNVAISNSTANWACEMESTKGKYYTFEIGDYLNDEEISEIYTEPQLKGMFPDTWKNYLKKPELMPF